MQKHIKLSYDFCHDAKQKGWRFVSLDKNMQTLTITRYSISVTPNSDNSILEILEVCVRTINEFFRFKEKLSHRTLLFFPDVDRKIRLLKEIPEKNIYDSCDHFIRTKVSS